MTDPAALAAVADAAPFTLRAGETVTDPARFAQALADRLDLPRSAPRARHDLAQALAALGLPDLDTAPDA